MRKPKPFSNKRIAMIASIALGVVSLIIPQYLDELWKALGYDQASRPWLSLTLSIVFFVAVPLLVLHLDIDDLASKLDGQPEVYAMTSSEAMLDASRAFANADLVLNTRIIFGDVDAFDSSAASSTWNDRLTACVKGGSGICQRG